MILRNYSSIFSFLFSSKNTIMINGQMYSVKENKKNTVRLYSFLFILFPALVLMITELIDRTCDLALFPVLILYIAVYLLAVMIFTPLISRSLVRHCLVKD